MIPAARWKTASRRKTGAADLSLRNHLRLIRHLDELSDDFRGGAVTIGNFDGVHLGHRRIIEHTVTKSRLVDGPAVVLTFDPHPADVLRPGQAPPPLSRTGAKAQLLGELGVDAIVAYPTDKPLLQLDAREFFDQIVLKRLDARVVIEGPNFFFGRGRQGDIGLLRQFCIDSDLLLEIVEPVEIDGQIVSSSRIRKLIASGKVDLAGKMLARPYRVRGTVVRGAGRGADLGFPTANMASVDTLLPGQGIYAARALVDGRMWPAAVSLGPNPTFDEDDVKIEVHLVDYAGQLYNRQIEVDFLTRLRDIERFDSVGELVARMDRDVATTREIVARHETGC